jgi:hypothetical protein
MAIQFDNTNTGVVTLRPGTATDAIIIGNLGNEANGTRSAVIGGQNCAAGGTNAVVVGGGTGVANGTGSVALGGNNSNASASFSGVLSGADNSANADSSIVLGGRNGTTRSIQGNTIIPASVSPISAGAGVNQFATLILARQTTTATTTVLTSNASGAGTTNQVILPNNSAYFFQGEVVAGVTGAGDTKGWTIEGVIKRGANAASTVLVGTPTVTSSYADAGASAWTIAVTADTTNGGLAITVTGQAATTIRWVAQIRTTEMTY